MTAQQIGQLSPNQPSEPKPIACWNFENGKPEDALGAFPAGKLVGKARTGMRIFIDKYLVEVFANDRQAVVASHADYAGKRDLTAFTVGAQPRSAKSKSGISISPIKVSGKHSRTASGNRRRSDVLMRYPYSLAVAKRITAKREVPENTGSMPISDRGVRPRVN